MTKAPSMSNPFLTPVEGYPRAQTVDAVGRIDAVRAFDYRECEAALEVDGLQKTVQTAVRRRMRQLRRATSAATNA